MENGNDAFIYEYNKKGESFLFFFVVYFFKDLIRNTDFDKI